VRPDWIFHLAARGAYSWQNDIREIMHANLVLTVNLIQACLKTGFEAFINTGSSSEYGYKDHAPAESELPEPNSIYAAFKASATLFGRYVAQSSKLNITTLRLYSVYGPFEDPRRLFPTLIREGLQGRLPPLVNPDIARDFVYVDDVIEAYLAAASKPTGAPGAVYNVGTGVQTTICDVVAIAKRLMRINDEPKWGTMPDRNWDTTVWVADTARIRKDLGWAPAFDLTAGFTAMIRWALENHHV
jgi:dolichol-phosphate mannosyltransferase